MNLLFLGLSLFMVSCASKHSMMRGSVAMKIDESKGIACLESDEVKVGDVLNLYNNECEGAKGKDGAASCKMVPAGKVEVTRLVNDHYSEFVTKDTVRFEEGSIIGKSK